jgi:hypothetical protein
MIAVHLGRTGSTSSLTVQCIHLHADCSRNQMTGQQHRADRQNAPEEEEAFQLSAGRSYAPMRRLILLPVCHPYS